MRAATDCSGSSSRSLAYCSLSFASAQSDRRRGPCRAAPVPSRAGRRGRPTSRAPTTALVTQSDPKRSRRRQRAARPIHRAANSARTAGKARRPTPISRTRSGAPAITTPRRNLSHGRRDLSRDRRTVLAARDPAAHGSRRQLPRERGDYVDAVSAYSEARTVNRRAFGLLNEDQIPLLDRMTKSLIELNKPLEADQQQLEALRLVERSHPPESDEALAAIYKYAGWLRESGALSRRARPICAARCERFARRSARTTCGRCGRSSASATAFASNGFPMGKAPARCATRSRS